MKDETKKFLKNTIFPHIKFALFGKLSIFKFAFIFIIAFILTIGYNLLISYLQIWKILPQISIIDAIYEIQRKELIIKALILAPIVEELIFRGFLYMILRKFIGSNFAMLISAILFGIYHMDINQGLYAFLFSFALVGIIRIYGDIFSAIIMHFLSNAIALYLTYNKIFDKILLNNEYSIIIMLICIILGNILLFFYG